MTIRFFKSRDYIVGLLIIFGLLFFGCSSEGNRGDKVEVDMNETNVDSSVIEGVQTAKQIFYSLPSPLETALILKRSGAKYNEEILNSPDNISRYNTNRSMALNLGIYSTDLSYASLFDQTQASIKYMSASKKMAEGLGILNAIDNSIIQKLEENVNNRDVIMDIISETFLNTNSILEENDRVATGSVILVGGWVEGLYIATSLIDNVQNSDNELVARVIDQKLSLETVINLLNQNKGNPDVASVMGDVEELKKIFDQVQISVSEVEAIPDPEGGVTTLRSQSVSSVSPAVFNQLKTKIQEIRSKYIK